jgi:hypothetical protein
MEDYYGWVGCCITCKEYQEGCLCPEGKCSECSWLVNHNCACPYSRIWESHVEFTYQENLLKLRIYPVLTKQHFIQLTSYLRYHSFQYDADEQVWTVFTTNLRFVAMLKQHVREFGIEIVEVKTLRELPLK